MTWYFDAKGKELDLYDPEERLVAENIEFSGAWSDAAPRDRLREEVVSHLASGGPNSAEQAVLWAFQWLSGDIEQGKPPERQ